MNIFKTIALLSISSFCVKASAQVVDPAAGKTYYYHDEASQKKVKEIYHHKQVVIMMPDKDNYGSYIDTMVYQKHGPYTRYDDKGHLECSGYFNNEKKDSLWKYYNTAGDMVR